MEIPNWANANDETREYYSAEWGKLPTSDDAAFEMLSLLIFQAGLTWATVLSKREDLRVAFSNFKIEAVAKMSEEDVSRLLQGASPIKNERKIRAVIQNARAIQEYRSALRHENRRRAFLAVLENSAGKPGVWPVYGEEQMTLLRHFFNDWGFAFTGPKVIRALVESFGLALPWLGEDASPAGDLDALQVVVDPVDNHV
ncbi:DNA-3-methyladenine glycosylase I [uncultured Actinomyces sp.]|uniref:DNA-3-methyladenine glycosylase I n=1 Tax=uncultured Actinomyces sp. TaxID=249061 RepID=UPI002616C3A7|nr:DNA-3-methyladenine glycosylase I [uncultured Actinomyces sp.]